MSWCSCVRPIPPETLEEVQRLAAHLEGKSETDRGENPSDAGQDEVVVKIEIKTQPMLSVAGPSEVPSSAFQQLGRPQKRRRESSDEDKSSTTPECEEMSDLTAIIIPSSSNSSTDTTREASPMIDLTQS